MELEGSQPRLAAVRAEARRDPDPQRRADSFRAYLDRRVLDNAYRYATLILGDDL